MYTYIYIYIYSRLQTVRRTPERNPASPGWCRRVIPRGTGPKTAVRAVLGPAIGSDGDQALHGDPVLRAPSALSKNHTKINIIYCDNKVFISLKQTE